jgi:FkbH-like protein
MHSPIDVTLSRLPESARPAVSEALGETPTWVKIRRANAALDGAEAGLRGPEVAVNLLASFNLEPIEPALRLGLQCIPCRPQLWTAPLNTIEQTLLDMGSPVYQGSSLATVVLWRIEELLPEVLLPFSSGGADVLKEQVELLWSRMERVCRAHREMGKSPLFVSTFPAPRVVSGLVLTSQLVSGPMNAVAELNRKLYELAASAPGIHVLDLNWWAGHEGTSAFDPLMEQMARQPLSLRGALSLGLFVARHLRPLLAPRRKVLVLDLDNTLWGGILGEDGIPQLKLGHDFPGNIFLRIQREARELKNQGVLLALLSKNDEAEVRQAFRELPDMELKWEDFVSKRVNFNHKHENLREMAEELGLGIDSFATLDDSDYEREQIRMFHPDVLVINQRSDPLHMLQALQSTDAFDAYAVTAEDRGRHREYELREMRSIQGRETNLEEFLRSLHLTATIESVHEGNVERVVQMLSKTNQFNLTTRRHRLEELKALVSIPGSISLTLRLSDKFGDQGIVGVLLAVPADDGRRLRIESYLVSCRALGRGVEEFLWAELARQALDHKVHGVIGEYIPTPKNGLAKGYYDKLGFTRVEEGASMTRYLMEPLKPVKPPVWLASNGGQ